MDVNNTRRAAAMERAMRGYAPNCAQTSMTPEQVLELRALHAAHVPPEGKRDRFTRDMAERYGIGQDAVRRIIRRETWGHL